MKSSARVLLLPFVILPLLLLLALPLRAQNIVTLDRGNSDTGGYTSQVIVNGNPAISYYDGYCNNDLTYVRANDVNGTSWGTPVIVDSTGDVGSDTSLAVVNGNPAISYYDFTNGALKYVRANDASGTSWGTPVTVDSTGDVGRYTSLLVVNGNPAISYYDATNDALKYVRASNASGTSWGTPVIVDSSGGQYSSLVLVNGNPAISYYVRIDFNTSALKYVRANDVNGTSWGIPVTVDSTGDVGRYTSLLVVNGNPAISYHDSFPNSALKYVRANDVNGTNWGAPVIVDSAGGQYGTSLAVVNGFPAISYHGNGNLKYVRALDANGTSWGTPVTVDNTGLVGFDSSLAVINGNPAISYRDVTNGDLKYTRALVANGGSWGTRMTLDRGNSDTGGYTSQVIVNGNPAISYYDGYCNNDLKYVRATNVNGTSWGTPVIVDSTGDVGLYTSLAVVNGNPAISYYDFTNGALKYVRANDVNGTSWGTPVTVGGTGGVGRYTSLVVVNGFPAISYYDNTNGNHLLKYVRATNVNGTSWGTPVTVDNIGLVGEHSSLAVVNGNPAISYYDFTNGALKYVRANDVNGTSWGTRVIVDSNGDVGRYTSLLVVNGNPAISYHDNTNGNLKYVRANDASGTSWGTPVIVDSPGGQYGTSLAVVNGNPAISYASNGLAYVRALDANGTNWGTSLTVDSTGLVGFDSSLAVVNGNPAISYRDATNGHLKWAIMTPPAITSANNTTFTVGVNGSFTVTATGNPTPTLSITGTLPSNVNFDTGTGVLSGTPAAGTGGTYPITFTASNGVGSNAVQSFTLTVNQAPAITSANSTTFVVGSAGTFTVTKTGYPTPTLSYTGALPSGVNFNTGTGVLSGTPDAGTGGTYPITFTASNGVGSNAVQNFTLTVNQAPAITSANNTTFVVGSAGTFTVTKTGFPTPTLSYTGVLPVGVNFNTGTGVLSGTPDAGTGGTYPITFTASNGVGSNAVQNFTLTVNQAPAITSANNTTFVVGSAGTFTVTKTGFPTPTLSQSGQLPSNVNFDTGTGVLSGTPTAGTEGTYPITFTASNGVPPNAMQSFTLTVSAVGVGALDGLDPNANGSVRVVVVQPDGKILIGGEFTTLSPNGGASVTRNHIARLNHDGTLDTAFNPNANSIVWSIALQADGKILAGGDFTIIGGPTRNRIARLDAATGLADSFNPNASATVRSIAVQADGKILAGGDFATVGGQNRNRIARLDPTTGMAESFDPNASGTVRSIAVQADGKILVGGDFTAIGGQNRNRIARLDATTGLAELFDPSANNIVLSIAVQADGKVLAGGSFTNIGGQTRNRIARLDATTGLADSFNPNGSNSVASIAVQADGKILAGGNFSGANSIGGQLRNRIARLDPATGLADSFDPNPNSDVYAIAVQADGKILAGGIFTTVAPNGGAAVTRRRIARFETDGRLDQTLNLSTVGSDVRATALQPDGKIVIGGTFSSVLGVPRNNIARLNTDGTLDTVFNPNANNVVYAIAVQADGQVLAGGSFTNIGGPTRNRIARLDAITGLADSFNPNATSTVFSIAVQADGKILAGGNFGGVNGIGGQTRNRIARLDATTGLADSFDPKANNTVNAIGVQADGKVLAGGVFTTLAPNGGATVTRNRIARLNPDGTLDTGFNPNANSLLTSIAVQADGKILAGGTFTNIGSQPRNRIARLDDATGLADSFNPDANDQVNTIALQADGRILAGGIFTTIGAQTRNRIARFNGTTGMTDSLDPTADGQVYAIAVQMDGKVLAAGDFTNIGGQSRSLFARLSNDTPALQNVAVTPSAITWTRSGSSPQFTRVTFEYSTDNLNYTPLGNGTATGSNWTLTGLSLSSGQNIYIRARGYFRGGYLNGSESITELVRNAFIAPPVPSQIVSRKIHGGAGTFDVDLPLTGTSGVECRSGGGTNDFTMVVTFASNVTVTGSPQAQVILGTGTIGSGGVSNGGMVTVSGNTVTIQLTNVADQQTINVTLNGVNGASDQPAANVVIPMSRLLGDTNGNRSVNAGDVSQTKARIGQTVTSANFRSDLNANGSINAGDVSQAKVNTGHGLP